MLAGQWVLTELNGKPVAGGFISLEFDPTAGRAAGSTGVNRWNGSYELSGQTLEFGPLVTTRRAGTPEAMQREREFTQALDNVTQFAGDDRRLVLSSGEELLVFERARQ
jgi:heat shock protein HslJ